MSVQPLTPFDSNGIAGVNHTQAVFATAFPSLSANYRISEDQFHLDFIEGFVLWCGFVWFVFLWQCVLSKTKQKTKPSSRDSISSNTYILTYFHLFRFPDICESTSYSWSHSTVQFKISSKSNLFTKKSCFVVPTQKNLVWY